MNDPSRSAEDLATEVRRLAEKVVRSGRPVPVEPMSPQDRKVVHKALADHSGVRTESEGEGAARRVVIFPKHGEEVR